MIVPGSVRGGDRVKHQKKANVDEVRVHRLKKVFSGRDGRVHHSSTDVRWEDIEEKNRTDALLIGGPNLHDLAAKGSRCFKKALAYSMENWDNKTMETKESGWSVDDVIEHVRKKVCVELVGPSDEGANENASDEQSKSEEIIGVDDAVEKEKMRELKSLMMTWTAMT